MLIVELIFSAVIIIFYLFFLIFIWLLRRLHLLPKAKGGFSFLSSTWFIAIFLAILLLVTFYNRLILPHPALHFFYPFSMFRLTGRYVSEKTVVKLFEECQIESWGLPHANWISIELKDGRRVYTDRNLDDVMRATQRIYVNKCGGPKFGGWIE